MPRSRRWKAEAVEQAAQQMTASYTARDLQPAVERIAKRRFTVLEVAYYLSTSALIETLPKTGGRPQSNRYKTTNPTNYYVGLKELFNDKITL